VAFAARVFKYDDVVFVLQSVWRFIQRRAGGQIDANEGAQARTRRNLCAFVRVRACVIMAILMISYSNNVLSNY